jgi:GxxExxY protein
MKNDNFQPIPQDVEKVGKDVLDACFIVHSALGPWLLESVYEKALSYELSKRGNQVIIQVRIPIIYDGKHLDSNLICDMMIDACVILELKAVENLIPLHEAQLLTYLKLSGIRLGYLINFNVPHLKTGIKRLIR